MIIAAMKLKYLFDKIQKKRAKEELKLKDDEIIFITNRCTVSESGKVLRDEFLIDEFLEEDVAENCIYKMYNKNLDPIQKVENEYGETSTEFSEYVMTHLEALQKLIGHHITVPKLRDLWGISKEEAKVTLLELQRLNIVKKYPTFAMVPSFVKNFINLKLGGNLNPKEINMAAKAEQNVTLQDEQRGIRKERKKGDDYSRAEAEVLGPDFAKKREQADRKLDQKTKKKKPLASGTGVDVKTQAGLSARKKEKDQRKFITSKEEKARRAKI